MLLVTFTFFFLTVHQSLTLKCYYYEEQHGNFWIDTRTLPQFPTNYTIIEGKNQCAASIRWFTLPDGKESFVDYRNDMPIPNLPKNASFPFVVAGAHRELQAASTRALIYGCATDYCNNRTNLLKALTSLLLRENFAPLDILFSNGTRNFTEQNSCVEFSNATRIKCPSSATPLSSCSYCFLSEKDSPQEFCARCPEESGPSFDFAFREIAKKNISTSYLGGYHFLHLSKYEKNDTSLDSFSTLTYKKHVIFIKSALTCIVLCQLLKEHPFTSVGIHPQMKEDDRSG